MFAAGLILGGFLAGALLADPHPIRPSAAGLRCVQGLDVQVRPGLIPAELKPHVARQLVLLAVSGLLVGFGTR